MSYLFPEELPTERMLAAPANEYDPAMRLGQT